MPKPFVEEITVEHGPRTLLGLFFLCADTAARYRGVTLSFAPLEELVATNKANRSSWLPLVPILDPGYAGFEQKSALCLLGRNSAGEIVLTQAARFFDFRKTSLATEATSLRMLYRDPEKDKYGNESVVITAPYARRITGKVAYTGGHWCRPDFRRRKLSAITPLIARALAITLWDVRLTCTFMFQEVYDRQIAARAGYGHAEVGVEFRDTRLGTHSGLLLWSRRNEIVASLKRFTADPEGFIRASP